MSKKEKLLSLEVYLTNLKNRLDSPTPEKHLHRPNEYREFLTREIKKTSMKVEDLRLVAKDEK